MNRLTNAIITKNPNLDT